MDKLSYREALVEDMPFVLSVRNQYETRRWLETSATFTDEEGIEWFKNTHPKMLILSKGEQDVGYFRTSEWTSSSVCIGCDIHPEFRGRGLGYGFYNIIINDLKDKGIVRFWLKVFGDNLPALGLYKKLGFKTMKTTILNNKEYHTMELHI